MVTKLICQLPDVDAFGRTGRLSFDPKCVKDLGWVPNDWPHKFNPDHVKDILDTAQNTPKQRSYQMELRSRKSKVVQMLFIIICKYLYCYIIAFHIFV